MVFECTFVAVSRLMAVLTVVALLSSESKDYQSIFLIRTLFMMALETITVGIAYKLDRKLHGVFLAAMTVMFYVTQFFQAYCCFLLFAHLDEHWTSQTLVACVLRATIAKCIVGLVLGPIYVLALRQSKTYLAYYLESMRQIYGFPQPVDARLNTFGSACKND